MQFTIYTVLAVAATAFALPTESGSSSGGSGTCAEGSQISCCVTDSSDSGAAGNVLGGSCLLDQVSLLSGKSRFIPPRTSTQANSSQPSTTSAQLATPSAALPTRTAPSTSTSPAFQSTLKCSNRSSDGISDGRMNMGLRFWRKTLGE